MTLKKDYQEIPITQYCHYKYCECWHMIYWKGDFIEKWYCKEHERLI